MGIAGSGKSTVGAVLARFLGFRFQDADDHHPTENRAKMARGEPLTDSDRQIWLQSLALLIRAALCAGEDTVLACSALKEAYRAAMGIDHVRVRLVYLKLPAERVRARLRSRVGHFMKEEMLESQLAALEEPAVAFRVDASETVEVIVQQIVDGFGLSRTEPGRR